MIANFLTANPEFELRAADLINARALAQYNWPEGIDQQELLQSLRIRQRLLKIYPDDNVAEKLESLGFHSAHDMVSIGKSAFTQRVMPELAGLTGIKHPKAFCTRLFGNAERIRRSSFELALAVPKTSAKVATPLMGGADADFQQGIPDYQRLFGPMFTCDCKDCQSIFGPAAYFTDLMRVISQYVIPPLESLFSLRYRRPDLWTIPLDCSSSESEIRYLDIVNEVICQHLKVNYLDGADPMQQMASRVYPFSTPFNGSLRTIRGGLEALGTDLPSIYRLLETPVLAASAEVLKLSPEQLAVVTGSYQVSLARLYGFHDESLSDEQVCSALSDQRVFLQRTGLHADQLEALVYQQLKKGSGSYAMQDKGSQDIFTEKFLNSSLAGSMTIECWIYPTAAFSTMSVVGKGEGGGDEFYISLINQGDKKVCIKCHYKKVDGTVVNFISIAVLNLYTWVHVAWSRDAGKGENNLYINGALDQRYPATAGNAMTGESSIGIGYISNSSFQGGITELRIWAEVRSIAQIQAMMHLRLQNYTEDHLFAYWPLNEPTGKTANDLGPHHYNAAGSYATAFYDTVPIGSNSELIPTMLHGLYLNNLLPSDQFIAIAKPEQDNALLNLFSEPELVGLSAQALLQIAAFLRIQAETGWSFEELDWLIRTVVTSLNIPAQLTINNTIIESLGQVGALVKKYDISIDELSSFWCDMKTFGRGNEVLPSALWDRVFNTPPFMARDTDPDQTGYYRPEYALNSLFTSPVMHWSPQAASGSQDSRLGNQLAAALKISVQDLYVIAQSTAKSPGAQASLALDVPQLSQFYRIARFSEMLDLSVPDFIQLCVIAGIGLSATKLTWTIPEVIRLTEISEWMKAARLIVKQLSYLTSAAPPDQSLQLLDLPRISKALADMMQSSQQVLITPTSFVGDGIDAVTALAMYNQLLASRIIDASGVVLMNESVLTPDFVFRSLHSNPETLDQIFPSGSERYCVSFDTADSGKASFRFDPFANETMQQTNCFTISAWLKPENNQQDKPQKFIGRNGGANNDTQWSPTIDQSGNAAGQLHLCMSFEDVFYQNTVNGYFTDPTEWVYVTWVNDHGHWEVFRNGIAVPFTSSMNPVPGVYRQSGSSPLYVLGNSFNGSICNVSIWTTARTMAEVQLDMVRSDYTHQPDLLAWWPVDEGAGTVISNHSENSEAVDGTLSGSYTWTVTTEITARIVSYRVAHILADTFSAQNQLVVKTLAPLGAVSPDAMAGICFLTSREVDNAGMFSNPPSNPYPYFPNLLLDADSQSQEVLNSYLSVLQRNTAMARWLKLTGQEITGILTYSELVGDQSISYGTRFLSLQQLMTLTDYKSLQDLCNQPNGLLDYFRQADHPGTNLPSQDQLALLSQLTGWMLADLQLVVSQPYFSNINFNTVAGLRKLANVAAMEKKIGTDMATLNQLRGLSEQNLFSGTSDLYWQHYNDAAVATLAMLEGKKGTAAVEGLDVTDTAKVKAVLCDWLIWELQNGINSLKNQQDLYEYLLIDVNMSPDIKTSWMVTAMNSLQLYVNRILSNIEPGVINNIPEIWWEWMSNYRVWQANREVYLYPENYVDPTLRKFQSPAFKTFITNVSKGQITDENVKQALAGYLESVNEVASLELIDGYTELFSLMLAGEPETNEKKAIHLIGRSRKKPFVFYSRTAVAVTSTTALNRDASFEDATYMHFGPWQEIEQKINSDYVSTVIAFGRQFIFWVEQTEVINTDNDSNKYTSVYASIYYTYRDFSGKWGAPAVFVKDKLIDIFGPAIAEIDYYEDYFGGARLGNSQTDDKFYKSRNWQEVKLQVLPPAAPEEEKILVTFGPLVSCPSSMSAIPSTPTPSEMIPEAVEYQNDLYLAAKRAYSRKGNVTTILEAHTLSSSLEIYSWRLNIDGSKASFIDYNTLPLDDKTGLVFFADTPGNDAEIDNLYRAPNAFWPMVMNMNLVEGTTIKSFYANTPGTFSENPRVATIQTPYDALKPVYFDGSLFATIPWAKYQDLSEFTVSFWVYVGVSSMNWNLLSFIFKLGNGYCGWSIAVKDHKFQLAVGVEAGISTQINQGTASDDTWYFVALTVRSSTDITLTVNDANSPSNAVPYTPVPSSSSEELTIGKSNENDRDYSQFVGSIMNLKLWKSPLSDQELLDEYQSRGLCPAHGEFLRLGNSATGFIYNLQKQSYLVLPCFEAALLRECLKPKYNLSKRNLEISFSRSPVEEHQEVKMKLIRVNTDTLPTMIRTLATGGVKELLQPAMQYLPEEEPPIAAGENVLLPETNLMDFAGAFDTYFWEIFFYAPYYIAEKLRAAHKFPEAEKWYQYVFDPTNQQSPVGYWSLNRQFNGQFPDLAGREGATPINLEASSFSEESTPFSRKLRQVWTLNPAGPGYFSVPYSKTLNPPEFTVAAWINLASVPANGAFYSIVCSQSDYKGFCLEVKGKEDGNWSLRLEIGTTDSKWVGESSALCAKVGQWVYVAGTYDGKYLKVFIDGGTPTDQPVISENYRCNTTTPMTIGSGHTSTAEANSFDGSIAEVVLFDHALSDGELMQIYQDYSQLSLNSNFWNFRPFRRINAQSLYHILNGDAWQESFFQPAQYYSASLQMAVYEYDPFDPDTLARLRVNSWQKATFMRYLDNLISWGDSLFTQNTWETLSDATMQYTLATTLLGRIPVKDLTGEAHPTVNYNSMEVEYGDGKVPPFLIEMENQLSGLGADATLPEQVQSILDAYFCIPTNQQLLKYWELVADRLYKIRHGLSITGAPNTIPLYAPPIDPAVAVSLVAQGNNISTISASTSPVVPWYRFNYMIGQARSVTAEVVRLGGELLAALEKKDAERLSQLQAGYQLVLGNLAAQIKASQINQLQYLGEGLHANLDNAQYVHDTYKRWLKKPVSSEEAYALTQLHNAEIQQEVAVSFRGVAAIAYLFPNIFGTANGGYDLGQSSSAFAAVFDTGAQIDQTRSQQTSQTAQFNRRQEEWEMQLNTSANQIREIQAQIAANDFALQAAQQEMAMTVTQWKQSQEVYNFLRTKFTSGELYEWMSGQLSTLYFQMFQLAWSLAQSTQTALQYEQNLKQTYLNSAAWNAGYQGLLAGDALSLALQQMENAYISNNNRKLEIRKTWSMRQNNPQALLTLISSGNCRFDLSELSYDLDFPGHYNRKIQSLSITIPAVVGPYQNIHATLTQTGNTVVVKPNVAAVEYLLGLESKAAPTDGSLRINWNPNQEIIISTGVNDAGAFQANFNDERYLPFEGTGAVSSWHLRIPQASNGFPLRAISDVIITVEYIAEDGGSTYASQITALAPLANYKGCQYLSLRQLYSAAWFDFCENPLMGVYSLAFELVTQMYPSNLDKGSIRLGDANGKIGLVPVMQQGYAGALPAFTMNDSDTSWVEGEGISLIATDDPLVPLDAQPVPGKDNPWTLHAKDVPEVLLANSKIDQTKLLDIILLVPFSGRLNW